MRLLLPLAGSSPGPQFETWLPATRLVVPEICSVPLVRRSRLRRVVPLALLLWTAHPAASEPAPRWRSTALVTATSSIPDLPAARFVDFGTTFARPGGEVVFWAKLAGREEKRSWALFSIRDGMLKTILEEGEEVVSRYASEPGRKFHVHYQGRLHTPLFLHAGEMLCFTSHPGALMKEAGVFGWDGERIRTLLAPGQSISLGGRTETIESAWGGAPHPAGGIQVDVRTSKPSKRTVQAILVNGELRLPEELEPAPEFRAPAWWAGSLGSGDPFPYETGRIMAGTSAVKRQSATRWVMMVITDDRRQHYVYGDGSRLFDLTPPGLSQRKNWTFAIDQVEFLHPDRPLVLYRGQASYHQERPYAGTEVYLFDGESVRALIGVPIHDVSGRTRIERVSGGRFPGALIRALRGGAPDGAMPEQFPLWYLDRENLAAGLQPVPDLAVEGGGSISLGAVQAWLTERRAIAATADGIYRLEETSISGP